MVKVLATPLSFRVKINVFGVIEGTDLKIGPYTRKFDHVDVDEYARKETLIHRYRFYDRAKNEVYLPRYDIDNFRTYLAGHGLSLEIEEIPTVHGDPIHYHMLPHIDYNNDAQKAVIEDIARIDPASPIRVVALNTGWGKALPMSGLLYTPSGFITMREAFVGMDIYTPRMTVTKVVGVYPQGRIGVWRITLSNGRSARCSKDHLWKVRYTSDLLNRSEVIEFKHIITHPEKYKIPARVGNRVRWYPIKSIDYVGVEECQCIEVEDADRLYMTDDFLVTHNTVGTIWGCERRAVRTLITMSSRMKQWEQEYQTFTDIDPSDVFIVKGKPTLEKLFSLAKHKVTMPSVVIASTPTMKLYLEHGPGYSHLPHPDNFCEIMGFGVVATDEYHEHFHSNFMHMLRLNPEVFVTITATVTSTPKFTLNIMNQLLPKHLRIGEGVFTKTTNIVGVRYEGGGGYIEDSIVRGPKGYSQNKLEKFFVKKGKKFFGELMVETVIPLLNEYFFEIHREGEKLLILCNTQELCHKISSILGEFFPKYKRLVFISGVDESLIPDYDIIISTPGSCGTGRDIKHLRTTFSFIATQSEIYLLQHLGRLRPPGKTAPEDPYYVYLYFALLTKHLQYERKRSDLYRERGKTYVKRKR